MNPNTLIVTFDITNLYNNITHELRKEAFAFLIDNYPHSLHPRFNNIFIIEGIEIILNNSFQFNKMKYIQTLGTGTGTKTRPTYATLTLAFLEENLYEIIGEKYSDDIKGEFSKS